MITLPPTFPCRLGWEQPGDAAANPVGEGDRTLPAALRHFGTVAMSDSFAFGTFVPRKPPPGAPSPSSPQTVSGALAFKEKREKREQVGTEQLAQPASPSSFPNLAVLPAA